MTSIKRPINGAIRRLRNVASGWRSALEHASLIAENLVTQADERLIIIDDFFPSLATPFRIAEFNSILSCFDSAVVYSTCPDKEVFSQYTASYPELADRVRKFHPSRRLKGCAAYAVFLNNIYGHLESLENARLPFIFELYPGGGFYLNEAVSDAHLRRVFTSPMFRKVITTQNVTRDYLLRKKFCRFEDIEFVFGVVMLSNAMGDLPDRRVCYGLGKQTIDICFVANKYMPRGMDKGYDRFIGCARILGRRHPEAHFHIVGNFTEDDVEVGDLSGRISFYGHQLTPFFPKFYSRMDIILSPNVPFLFAPGAFDGFPTGCCVEAALCGTAMFVSDELGMNEGRLTEDKEIVIISCDPEQIARTVEDYVADPRRLALLAKEGQRAVRTLFDLGSQMAPRLRTLSNLLVAANR
jgi:glycosyltransferase involved in cell wall biosynthesis